MNWKSYLPLAVAVVLGLFAARIGLSLVNSGGPKLVQGPVPVPVVAIGRDIEPGVALQETDLITVKVNPDSIPSGAFTGTGPLIGRVTKIALVRGQALTPNLLADDGAGYGVGATLPAGMRAVTIDISDTTGVAGFILPKCKVDVVATLQLDGKSVAKTVLEGVSVLAVGSRTSPTTPTDPQAPQSKTVTLLVKPKDVEKVELAATMSRIRLVLRNGRDETASDSEGVTLAELRGKHDADPFADDKGIQQTSSTTQPAGELIFDHKPAASKQAWTVQVIKGGVVTQQAFDTTAAPPKAEDPLVNTVNHPTDADTDTGFPTKTADVRDIH